MNTVNLFMSLLSAGINKTKYYINELLTIETWDDLYKYSIQQNVLPIIYEQLVFSGVFDLADRAIMGNVKNEQEKAFVAVRYRDMFRDKAIGLSITQVQRTEQFYEYYEHFLKNNIKPIVVKGIVCRNTYPNPDLRPSGDEDFYIRVEDYPKIKEILFANGFIIAGDSSSKSMEKEIEFLNAKEGLLFEVHTSLMPKNSSFYDKHNAVFYNAFDQKSMIIIEGNEIYTLEETQHVFFLFIHLLKHFVAGGVGIRQLCDILMFIKKYHEIIKWEILKKWLRLYHLEVFWANLIDISIKYLAFEPEKYQVPSYDWIKPDSTAILKDMFEAGAYGTSSLARMHSANMTIKAAEAKKDGTIESMVGLYRTIFPTFKTMKEKYPYTKEKPYLLPVAYGKRIVNFLKHKNEHNDEKGRSVLKLGQERIEMLKKYGILK